MLFSRKIVLIIIFILALLSISAVNAMEEMENQSVSSHSNVLNSNSNGDVGKTLQSDDVEKSVTLKPTKLVTTYGSGEYFKVKAVDSKTKKPAPNTKIVFKAYTGKKYKQITKTTDLNGVARYSASTLGIGKHKIIVSVKNSKNIISKSKTSFVKISKAKLKISAPKVTNYYKKSGLFKATIKNKKSNKAMKGVKVLIKVFTGNKFKKYVLKTNKKGIVSISSKSLTKGLHKVVIDVKATSKVRHASAKSSIKIVDVAKYIKLKVNGHILNVKLADNKATSALVEKLKKGDIKINAHEYGGFEKVGNLGFSLPTSDKYITTYSGDVVLYLGNQLSLNYGSNSWEYTRLGKVQNVNSDELKNILGSGDVVITLSLK